jgi:hypothetical protein
MFRIPTANGLLVGIVSVRIPVLIRPTTAAKEGVNLVPPGLYCREAGQGAPMIILLRQLCTRRRA